jgi:hypothetical protein
MDKICYCMSKGYAPPTGKIQSEDEVERQPNLRADQFDLGQLLA